MIVCESPGQVQFTNYCRALAGRASLRDGGAVPSHRPPRGLPHGRPWAAAPHRRPPVCVEGLPTNDRAVGLRQADGMALEPQPGRVGERGR